MLLVGDFAGDCPVGTIGLTCKGKSRNATEWHVSTQTRLGSTAYPYQLRSPTARTARSKRSNSSLMVDIALALSFYGERAGEPVDFIDHHHIDPACFNVAQELFQGGAVEVATGIGRIIIGQGQDLPTQGRLAFDVGLAGLPLSV